VYKNSVIIPEEKVRIRTKGTHLLVRFLYRYGVSRIDATISETAMEIGFVAEVTITNIRVRVAVISPLIF